MFRSRKVLRWGSYKVAYRECVLDTLDPHKVRGDLGEDAILLCYEDPGKRCHRRLVADWLERTLGIEVPELTPEQESE